MKKGEFLDAAQGAKILEQWPKRRILMFSEVDDLGTITKNDAYIDIHIDEVLNLPLVDAETIKESPVQSSGRWCKFYGRHCHTLNFWKLWE